MQTIRDRIYLILLLSVTIFFVTAMNNFLAEFFVNGTVFQTISLLAFVGGIIIAALGIVFVIAMLVHTNLQEMDLTNSMIILRREDRILTITEIDTTKRIYQTPPNIFLSYAHEDANNARRLYNELKSRGYQIWFDKESLVGGQNWKTAVKKAIKESRFFIALLSTQSVNKKGFVQSELKEAIDVLTEYPESRIFLVPVRLNECQPPDGLKDLQWVDLFPDWDDGVTEIVKAIQAQLL